MSVYEVIEAESKGQRPDKGYGPMQVIALSLKGESGTPIVAEWYTKATTPVPTPGSSVDGDVTQGKFGMQFKKAKPEGGGGSTWKPRDPAEIAAIQRQASQRTAATLLAPLLSGVDPLTASPEFWERLWKLFDRATDRLELGIQTHAQHYGEARPEKRKDSESTGRSDVPPPAEGEFVAPPASPAENEMWSAV